MDNKQFGFECSTDTSGCPPLHQNISFNYVTSTVSVNCVTASKYILKRYIRYYEHTANMLHEQMKQITGNHTADIKYSFCFTLPMITDVYSLYFNSFAALPMRVLHTVATCASSSNLLGLQKSSNSWCSVPRKQWDWQNHIL